MPQPGGGNPGGGNPGGGNPGGGNPGGGNNNLLIIDGDNNANTLAGTVEDELIRGKKGDDTLFGAGGEDTLEGDQGNDILIGGEGPDTLDGGMDFDIAWYRQATTVDVNTILFGDYYSVFGYDFLIAADSTTITDIDPSDGDTGTDTLLEVEQAVFWDDDADGDGNAGLITIHLDGTNNAALAVKETISDFNEDATGSITSTDLLANDREFDSESISVASIDDSSTLGDISVSFNADGTVASINYDPRTAFDYLAVGEIGIDTFSYTVADPNGEGTTAIVTLEVEGRNDAPVIDDVASTLSGGVTEIADGATGENTDTHTVTGDITFSDVDVTDTHTASFVPQGAAYRGSFNLVGTPTTTNATTSGVQGWSFSIDDADIDDLAAGQVLTQHYDVTLDDGHGGTASATVTVSMIGTNDAPTIVPVINVQTNSEDDPATGIVTPLYFEINDRAGDVDSDDDASTLTYAFGDFANGDFVASAGGLQLNIAGHYDYLAVGETTQATATVTATDSHGAASNESTLIWTIAGANDGPTLETGTLAATEDGAAVTLDLTTLGGDVDSDDDATTLSYSVVGQPAEGSAAITGTTLSFDPGADFQDLAAGETREVGFLGFGFYPGPRHDFMHIDLGPTREWGTRWPVTAATFTPEPPAPKPLAQSRTMRGSGAAGLATVGAGGVEVAQEALAETQAAVEPLLPWLDTLRWVFIAVALLGIAVAVYARWDEWRREKR